MGDLRWLQMSEEERNAFLGTGGTGVLSFSTTRDDPPYSLPVSYGYDADTERFHFQLAFPPDSEKKDLFDRPISFVAHGKMDDGWRSVIATGELEELTDQPYDSSAIQERWSITIPLVDIFEEPIDNVRFRQFRLVPDKLGGRKEVGSQE